jgi:CheY-like chemotaxis protein
MTPATLLGATGEVRTGEDHRVGAPGASEPGAGVQAGSLPATAFESTSEGLAPRVRLRVLAVDDDRGFLDEIRGLLEDEGFEVAGTASDGNEAVALAGKLCPDVVLMDLRMPTLDGLEATRLIKQQLPLTQVVILSAYDDPGLQEGAEEAGVYCYLIKGCRSQLIRDVLLQAWSFKASLEARGRSHS